jgi:hypothetical protein
LISLITLCRIKGQAEKTAAKFFDKILFLVGCLAEKQSLGGFPKK